ncbi:glycosyltransferase [Lactobacillus delbrueckii]|uniref:glycosyltransferase n=1 Tax=Lactobacillus delbrueckii TaxID=1584 RepID=UPI0025AF3BA2|nr:glycosyltransferase [Lactobacillus delbrueckii]
MPAKGQPWSGGVEQTDTDLVMFVDSDSFLEPDAVRNLVQPFQDPKMGPCPATGATWS